MAFSRPTISELIKRVEGDIKSGLNLVTVLRRSFLGVMARVIAGIAHGLYGYLAFLEKQAFANTATGDYLFQHASIWNVTQKNATFAQFTLGVTGIDGTVVPANRSYRRSDGVEYLTSAEVILSGGVGVLTLTAVGSGELPGVLVGDSISILAPIAGLDNIGTVNAVLIDPDDAESDEDLQARLVDRIQNPPSGGAANDYIQWAKSIAGISRAWVGPGALGPGTVTVWAVNDSTSPITPSTAKLNEVAAYIETVRPATANVYVVAPVLLPLNMTIAINPNTTAVQAAIISELQDLIARDSSLAGAYAAPGAVYNGKILLSRINEAISIAVGESDHLIVSINGGTPSDITPAAGYLVVLGAITWQILA